MFRAPWLAVWVGILGGMLLGLGWGEAVGRTWSDGAPPSWERGEASVPFRQVQLVGALPLGPEAYGMDHFQSLWAGEALLEFTVVTTLASGGVLEIYPAARQEPGRQGPATVGMALIVTEEGVRGAQLGRDGETALACTGGIAALGRGQHTIAVSAGGGQAQATVDGQTLRCPVEGGGRTALRSGLRRVLVHRVDGAFGPPMGWPLRGGLVLLGGLLGALVGRFEGGDARLRALTWLPALSVLTLASVDGNAVVESLRIPDLRGAMLPFTIPAVGVALLKALYLSARQGRIAAWRGLAPALLVVPLAIIGGLGSPVAWVSFVTLALAVCGVVVVNMRRVRWLNLLSLGLVGLGGVALEVGLRHTRAGEVWAPSTALVGEFEALEAGAYTVYPDSGYPVAFGPREGPRIVAMGGSSTGGAFQNDDLREFYPARLQERLAVDVVNQGVGGWTTFHIARYLEAAIDALQPDLLTLYIGHNDLFTRQAVPYSKSYARWQQGPTPLAGLWSLRTLTGFANVVQTVAGPELQVAVPLADARANLESVIGLAAERQIPVLLMSEGTHPDPGALADYWELLEALAAEHADVDYLDAARALDERGSRMFLDDCHLTDAGHRALAELMAERIRERGWL